MHEPAAVFLSGLMTMIDADMNSKTARGGNGW